MSGSTLLITPISYNNDSSLNVIDILATQNIVAMPDETNAKKSLYIGASKDITLEATEDITINLGSNNYLELNDVNKVKSLTVTTDLTTTTLSGDTKDLVISGSTVKIDTTTFNEIAGFEVLSTTSSNGFQLDNNLLVNASATVMNSVNVGGNVVCNSNMFASTYNIFAHRDSNMSINQASLTGYAFVINSVDQLELLKYTKFSSSNDIVKRVALFGNNRLVNGNSDSNYTIFNELGAPINGSNVAISGGGGNATLGDGSISTSMLASGAVTSTKIANTIGLWDVSSGDANNVVYNKGNVGIGSAMSNPSYTLDVQGNANVSGLLTNYSDRRLKDEIRVIEGALDKVGMISGCTFNMKGSEKRFAGVIAQEIQAVLPEVVSEDGNGFLSVSYGNIVALLIEAIKDLKGGMVAMQDQIVALKLGAIANSVQPV